MEAKLDLDAYATSQTISLASLSLASKGTEAPRRLREFLLPAYRILHASSPSVQPLTFPSILYDSLRATIVQAELILLRILKFELRIPLPYEFLPRYLERTVGELNLSNNGWGGTEDYDGLGKEFQEEYKAVDLMDTGVSRACRMKILKACANARLSNLFPARAIAAACLYQTLNEGGMQGTMDVRGWLREVTNDRVDLDDFDEILNELKRVNDVEGR
ncbi:MAG: hypothetical protein M1836_004869 [Candelina mexicana]|nr:MAG: hypothetical protein M1836_004869 [Candelina mexicana]